jgi:hypothetical protein
MCEYVGFEMHTVEELTAAGRSQESVLADRKTSELFHLHVVPVDEIADFLVDLHVTSTTVMSIIAKPGGEISALCFPAGTLIVTMVQ